MQFFFFFGGGGGGGILLVCSIRAIVSEVPVMYGIVAIVTGPVS